MNADGGAKALVASGRDAKAARVIFEEAPNWMLNNPAFARLSNDLLVRRTVYSTECGTGRCYPDGQGLYRLPLDAAYAPGVPEFVLDVRSGSWAPDDAARRGKTSPIG